MKVMLKNADLSGFWRNLANSDPSSGGYIQQDNALCHKAQIISNRFLEHDSELILLKWAPQSPDLNATEDLCDVVEREICIMDV
ncbi:hypothetical protein P4O66_016492, partial [Electrophorus voltai]